MADIENLAKSLQSELDSNTPEEAALLLAQWVRMQGDCKNKSLYRSVFKTMVEKMHLKTITGQW